MDEKKPDRRKSFELIVNNEVENESVFSLDFNIASEQDAASLLEKLTDMGPAVVKLTGDEVVFTEGPESDYMIYDNYGKSSFSVIFDNIDKVQVRAKDHNGLSIVEIVDAAVFRTDMVFYRTTIGEPVRETLNIALKLCPENNNVAFSRTE